jgi:hypothetical protein
MLTLWYRTSMRENQCDAILAPSAVRLGYIYDDVVFVIPDTSYRNVLLFSWSHSHFKANNFQTSNRQVNVVTPFYYLFGFAEWICVSAQGRWIDLHPWSRMWKFARMACCEMQKLACFCACERQVVCFILAMTYDRKTMYALKPSQRWRWRGRSGKKNYYAPSFVVCPDEDVNDT